MIKKLSVIASENPDICARVCAELLRKNLGHDMPHAAKIFDPENKKVFLAFGTDQNEVCALSFEEANRMLRGGLSEDFAQEPANNNKAPVAASQAVVGYSYEM